MNSENNETSKPNVLILNLADKIDLKRGEKSAALVNLGIYYTWKNIKNSCKKNQFKISAPTWNDNFELPDRLYLISGIQNYFEDIFKKLAENTDNSSIRIYVNEIENKIIFKIKAGYYLELLTYETMKLLGSTENRITKDKNGENVPHLEITEVVLVRCNIVNNDYQQDSSFISICSR